MPFIMGLHADMEIDPEVAVGSRRALLICLPQYDCECTVAIDRGEVTLPEDMPEFPFKVNDRREVVVQLWLIASSPEYLLT